MLLDISTYSLFHSYTTTCLVAIMVPQKTENVTTSGTAANMPPVATSAVNFMELKSPLELVLPQNINEWQVNHVVDWLRCLKLTNDYTSIVKDDGIDGPALLLIAQKDQWGRFGFKAKADVLKIETGLEKLTNKL